MKRRPVLKGVGGLVGLGAAASVAGPAVADEDDDNAGGGWESVDAVTDTDTGTELLFETTVPDYDFLELQVAVEDQSGDENSLYLQADDQSSGYWSESTNDAMLEKAESVGEYTLTSVRSDRVASGSIRLGPSAYTVTPDTPRFTVSNGPMMSGSTGDGNGSLLRGFASHDGADGYDVIRVYSSGEMTGSVELFGRSLRDLPETDPGELPPLPREGTRYYTHEEVLQKLDQIQHSSQGAVKLETIGESIEGRELVVVKVGEGDTDVFMTAQQHGNEPTGSLAAMEALRELASGGRGRHKGSVLNELRVHTLVMHNPDGGMRNQRGNWAGVDANRQHDYEPGSTDNPSPESQAMIEYVDELDPLWVADLHTQGGDYVDSDGESIRGSNYWPTNSNADPDAVELSKKMNWAIYDRLQGEIGFANLSQYPGGSSSSIARNAYGIRGHGSVLLEITGQTQDRGQRMEGMFKTLMKREVEVLLEETAEGTLFDRDPDMADTIPTRGPSEPWQWEDAEGDAMGGEVIGNLE